MTMPLVPVYFEPVSDAVHQQWLQALKQHGILYMYGMFGCGKTAQAVHFAQTQFKLHSYFSANDPDFIEQVTAFFDTFKKGRAKSILILDDLQWLTDPASQQRLFALLLQRTAFENRLQILLLSRGEPAPYLTPLRITQALEVVDKHCFLLNQDQILSLIIQRVTLAHMERTHLKQLAKRWLDETTGIAMQVQLYLMRLAQTPYDLDTVTVRTRQDLQNQFDVLFMPQWPPSHREGTNVLNGNIYVYFKT